MSNWVAGLRPTTWRRLMDCRLCPSSTPSRLGGLDPRFGLGTCTRPRPGSNAGPPSSSSDIVGAAQTGLSVKPRHRRDRTSGTPPRSPLEAQPTCPETPSAQLTPLSLVSNDPTANLWIVHEVTRGLQVGGDRPGVTDFANYLRSSHGATAGGRPIRHIERAQPGKRRNERGHGFCHRRPPRTAPPIYIHYEDTASGRRSVSGSMATQLNGNSWERQEREALPRQIGYRVDPPNAARGLGQFESADFGRTTTPSPVIS